MKVLAITATSGRHWCMERTLAMFLEQDYKYEHILFIFNNSEVELKLDSIKLPTNKKIILLNQSKSSVTTKKYENLGQIYNDGLLVLEELNIEADIVTHMDDDDIYFPDHISEGVKGYIKGNVLAYKPMKSYFHDKDGIHLMNNVLEPSIFVNFYHLKNYGYFETNVNLHHKWLQPLIDDNQIFADKDGKSTFIYDWNVEVPVYKTSGNPNNPNNFEYYKKFSNDNGDGILTPLPKKEIERFYNLCMN